jgi:hypothetical protein
MQRIGVSANGRHFTKENGDAFFWLADTAWELFHRLSLADACHYLEVRASQGFNLVQAVVLAELDGIHTPNVNGDKPLMNGDPAQPNEPYFQLVDQVLEAAASRGLYVGILPTWGDKVNKRYEWAIGPEIFNEDNAYVYAGWLATRWRHLSHIVWILGGDRNPDERATGIWRAMARGILSVDARALITFHPQPMDGGSSSAWWHGEDWLSFNMLQTGHDRQAPVAAIAARDYHLQPVKPVLNGEPTYEAHPISFKLSEGYSTDAEIRRDAYLSVFAGACGHTYGCHSVWQFFTSERAGVNHPLLEWKEALHLAGAWQMRYLYRLIMERAPLRRVPGDDLLLEGGGAARADDGSYAYVYAPAGGKIVIDTRVLAGETLRTCWMSPKDGTRSISQTVSKTDRMEFISPNSGEGCDWVLIIGTK